MFSSLRPRSVYDVLAVISCTGLLAGGTAYAAATITGADVVNESLTTSDIKANSVYGGDIANDSISGYDVKESTLNLKPARIAVQPFGTPPQQDPCQAPTNATGRFCGGTTYYWTNYGNGFQPTGFFKDALGLVHLEGSVAVNSEGQAPGVIFVLPAGYRPAAVRLFGVYDVDSTGSFGYVKIQPDGKVQYKSGSGGLSTYLSLDGISFKP